MPRKQVFAINHNELLQQTRRMCAQSAQSRSNQEATRKQHLDSLRTRVERARQKVMGLRHVKGSPEFLEAKDQLAEARFNLRQAESMAASWGELEAAKEIERMNMIKQQHRETVAQAPAQLAERIRQEQLKEAQKAFSRKRHSRKWDPSTQAGNAIFRKFAALGPSNPKLLCPSGTRFALDRPKVPWLAVPQGLLFGYTPPPERRRRHTTTAVPSFGASGSRPRSRSRRPDDGEASPSDSASGTGGGFARPANLAKNQPAKSSRLRPASASSKRRFGSTAQSAASKSTGFGGTRTLRPPPDNAPLPPRPAWKAADGVSRIFSRPAYNRPQTAHERAQAALMVTPDRQLFRATRSGKQPWRPVRGLSQPFSTPVHNVQAAPARRQAGAATEASSFFDGA